MSNFIPDLLNHLAKATTGSGAQPPSSSPHNSPSSQVPETQLGQGSPENALGSLLAGVVTETPSPESLVSMSLQQHLPNNSPNTGANNAAALAGLLQRSDSGILQTLLKGLSGDESSEGGGKRKWPCRLCKQTSHSWAKCPQLNVINVIVSLLMSKQEQVNTENNLKRVSDTLLQLGLSPAALGINSQKDKTDNAQTGAAAALAAALNQSLGVTATASPATLLHSTPSWSQFTPPTPAQPLLAIGHAPTPAVPGDLRSLCSSLGFA